MIRAFRILTDGYDDGIVFSESRGKAYWCAVRLFCETFGCKPRDAISLTRVCRDERMDRKASRYEQNKFYNEGYIE
jgi:hypothetical protein